MKFEFVKRNKREFPVNMLCEVLEIGRSAYYAWSIRGESSRSKSNRGLVVHIQQVFKESRGTYGSRRVHASLRKQGIVCTKKRVSRLMQQEKLVSVHRRKYRPQTTNSLHSDPIVPNLLEQDFRATERNKKWVGDITFVRTKEGWLYLATIIDLYSRRVVGWATSANIDSDLVCEALKMAKLRREDLVAVIFHSDRGSQYASDKFRYTLADLGITPSMSRSGNVYDNAVAESFYHTLKVELVHRERYQTREEARRSISEFIEQFYNSTRLHSSLGYKSPIEFERLKAA